MSQEKPGPFTTELAKNARKGMDYEVAGAAIGAGIGAIAASNSKLKGLPFIAKLADTAWVGWLVGIVASLWTQRSGNHKSALKLDAKMNDLEQENKLLKETVVSLIGHEMEPTGNHAEKLKSERSSDCGCHLKH